MDNFFFGKPIVLKPSKEDDKCNNECSFEISTNYVREFSKGKSFDFHIWNSKDCYNNDEFIIDFVKYDQKLWAALKTSINEVPYKGSEYWEVVAEGVANVEFRQVENQIQWKYEDEIEWRYLFEMCSVSESEIKEMLKDLNIQHLNSYDSELLEHSTNAVQNKTLYNKFKDVDARIDVITQEVDLYKTTISENTQNIKELEDSLDKSLKDTKEYVDSVTSGLETKLSWGTIDIPDQMAIMTIDESDDNSKIVVSGDSSWIKGRRCLAKNIDNGVAICYLHEDDSFKFHDGTEAALDGSMGEFMVDFAENYVTSKNYGNDIVGVKVSPTEGTTKFRRVLLGAVAGSIDDNGTMHSIVGEDVRPSNIPAILEAHTAATNCGNGWDIMDYEAWNKITILSWAKHGTLDLDKIYGSDQFGNSVLLEIVDFTMGGLMYWIGGIAKQRIESAEKPGSFIDRFYIYDGVPLDFSKDFRTIDVKYDGPSGTVGKMLWGEHADLIPIGMGTKYSVNFYISSDPDISYVFRDISEFIVNVSENVEYANARLQYRGNITVIDNPEEFKQL